MRLFLRFLLLPALALSLTACVSSSVIEDTRVPEIEIDAWGAIRFQNKPIERGNIAKALHRAGIRKNQEINVLVPDNPDRHLMGLVAGELSHGGYSRLIFMTKRSAKSSVQDYRGAPTPPPPPTQRVAPPSQREPFSSKRK